MENTNTQHKTSNPEKSKFDLFIEFIINILSVPMY